MLLFFVVLFFFGFRESVVEVKIVEKNWQRIKRKTERRFFLMWFCFNVLMNKSIASLFSARCPNRPVGWGTHHWGKYRCKSNKSNNLSWKLNFSVLRIIFSWIERTVVIARCEWHRPPTFSGRSLNRQWHRLRILRYPFDSAPTLYLCASEWNRLFSAFVRFRSDFPGNYIPPLLMALSMNLAAM